MEWGNVYARYYACNNSEPEKKPKFSDFLLVLEFPNLELYLFKNKVESIFPSE